MNTRKKTMALVLACVWLFICGLDLHGRWAGEQDLEARARGVFGPLPVTMAIDTSPLAPDRIRLGKILYYDARISVDGTVSCARCHPFSLYASDGLKTSIGNRCSPNARNAPTILNAAGQIAEHWIGNRTSVEDQALQSVTGPASFGMPSRAEFEDRLKAIPGYAPLFRNAFPGEADPLSLDNFAGAVGAFERTLVTPSPFDAFLSGNASALTTSGKKGLEAFMALGCTSCHSGTYVGGGMYGKFGIVGPYWELTKSEKRDEGRFAVTKNEEDRYVFKVPGLRNVARTPPYFHDGSVESLGTAVGIMAKAQLGLDLSLRDRDVIGAFLESLTGKIPDDALRIPELPGAEREGAVLGNPGDSPAGQAAGERGEPEFDVSPVEDLMREHGVLARILLIYDEIIARSERGADVPAATVIAAAGLVRRFVEDYHEKLEESYIFPRLEKDVRLAGLVSVLREQHQAGRLLTDKIQSLAGSLGRGDPVAAKALGGSLRVFNLMYRPHKAREDTILFPAFHALVPADEFEEMGKAFEDREDDLFGLGGFERIVTEVETLEKAVGIYELGKFTPGD